MPGIHRPERPRVAPVEKVAERLRGLSGAVNVQATTAHHRRLGKSLGEVFDVLLNNALTPRRSRELVILRTACNCEAEYEFGHHVVYARKAGVAEDELMAVGRPLRTHRWAEEDLTILRMADELYVDDGVSDATWNRLVSRWSTAEIMELVVTCLAYRLTSGVLNTFGVQLEDGVKGWFTAD